MQREYTAQYPFQHHMSFLTINNLETHICVMHKHVVVMMMRPLLRERTS